MGASDTITRFEREIGAAVEAARLTGRKLVVAVSGGPDSLAMLYALHRLQDGLRVTLHVAHLDHCLRGDDSAADAEFVSQTCAKLGVAVTVEATDVLAFQKQHRMSLEEAAREARYRFLAHAAERVGANTVALGHTSDDQVETVMMNIIRGAGMRGLRGMTPISTRRISGMDLTLFRPLLNLSKQDTVAYCKALALSPRFDESNLSMHMTRNKVRHRILPMLREANPVFEDNVLRLSRNVDDALAVVDRAVDAVWPGVVAEEGEHIRIDREKFRKLDDNVHPHLMMRALSHVKGNALDIGRKHVDDSVRAVLDSPGSQLHLPGGLRLAVEQTAAFLYIGDDPIAQGQASPIAGMFPLPVPGVTTVGEWTITTERIETPPPDRLSDTGGRPPGKFIERFGPAVDVPSLAVRNRVPGDRFQPLGMSGAKKLKDFMIDRKIPNSLRDSIPLIVTSRGIAWVVGWRIAEWAKVDHADRECLQITVERAK